MTDAPKSTLAEEVYAKIRARLLTGDLLPGSRLKISAFSDAYGVSLSVVREAVTRLAEQGLVKATPQRGFTVAPLSVADLLDLTRARVLVETLALRESIGAGDISWESRVVSTHHILNATPTRLADGHVDPTFARAHREFHEALLSGCGSTRLELIAMALRDCSELYQHWSQELAQDRDRDIAGEHRTIANLSVSRDVDGATAALARHIERTTEALIRYAEGREGAPGALSSSVRHN